MTFSCFPEVEDTFDAEFSSQNKSVTIMDLPKNNLTLLLVSVIIPAYNAEAFENCVRS
jgi:hypothetical protein